MNPRRAVLCAAILIAACALGACSSPAALAFSQPSDEALARAVLDAVARKDRAELLRLALDRTEFEAIVWPTLPASRPEVGMPSAYVWQDTFAKSRLHLARTIDTFGGRRLELVRLRFGGPTTENGTFSVSRKARLVVRNEGGMEETIRLFGSIIRQRGRSKVYSYIVD